MKIQQNCNSTGSPKTCRDLEVGTVFKTKGSGIAWLKAQGGYFNLAHNQYYSNGAFAENTEVDLVYLNARIVLE